MNFTPKQSVLMLAMMSAFASQHAYADDNNQQNQQETQKITSQDLEYVVVKAEPFAQKMGTQRINQKQIASRIKGNGTITDLLRGNPNIQFSNTSGSSESAGEIKPENVSFHGEKFYNNNWQIDGMSNNDNTNPGAGAGYSNNSDGNAADLPDGGSQSFYVNADILQRVDVYDSNISAKYGQFTGGVVDAKLKDPDLKKSSGSISYRTTRDSWARYHVEDESFYSAEQNYQQPKFVKNSYALNLNQPIGKNSGLMFSYSRTTSKIPQHHHDMNVWENQMRVNENFILKGLHKLGNGDTLKATAIYSPHANKQLRNDVKNGSYTNNGGGLRFNLEWKHLFERGSVESYLGYQSTQNRVKNESEYYTTYNLASKIATSTVSTRYSCSTAAAIKSSACVDYTLPSELDWVSSYNSKTGLPSLAHYGGYGTFETTKQTLTAKQDYEFNDLKLGKTKHDVMFGWSADFAKAGYKRETDVYNYGDGITNIRAVNGRDCTNEANCGTFGQYHIWRDYYPARSVKVGDNHYAAYIQDKIQAGKWEITAGLRLDHNRTLKNTNLSPRLAVSYDVFGNEKTMIFGGANRYYSNSILANKLKRSIGTGYRQTRALPTDDWTTATRPYVEYVQPDNLKTPHSEELNIGLRQRIGNSEWTAKWVHRNSKNSFGWENVSSTDKTTVTNYRVLNNKGKSTADTITLTWNWLSPIKTKYANIHLSGSANYSRNKTNAATYDGTSTTSVDTGRLNESDEQNKVIFDGKLINKNDMPALDFNTPWTLSSNIDVHFPKIDLNWATSLAYKAGYKSYATSLETCPTYSAAICGDYSGSIGVYEKTKYKNVFLVNMRLSKAFKIHKNHKLELDAEINNVFDKVARTRTSRANVSGNTPSYTLGRNFWLGAKYSW